MTTTSNYSVRDRNNSAPPRHAQSRHANRPEKPREQKPCAGPTERTAVRWVDHEAGRRAVLSEFWRTTRAVACPEYVAHGRREITRTQRALLTAIELSSPERAGFVTDDGVTFVPRNHLTRRTSLRSREVSFPEPIALSTSSSFLPEAA